MCLAHLGVDNRTGCWLEPLLHLDYYAQALFGCLVDHAPLNTKDIQPFGRPKGQVTRQKARK